jgi:hypothetical protein
MPQPTGQELYHCPKCRLWNDGIGFPEGQDFEIWTLPNGMTMTIPGVGTVPLHSDFVPCDDHKAQLKED